MNKTLIAFCFYFPLINVCLNLQGTVSKFVSHNYAQFIAYFNLVLIIGGVILFRKSIKTMSKTNRLWIIFYALYYSFGLLASGAYGFKTSIIATLVPLFYFFGYNFLLSDEKQFRTFFKVITICYVISAILTIVLIKMNINVYSGEVHGWEQDRAGGITGDANAAAHTSIFAFILFNQLFKPKKIIFRIVKVAVLATLFYSLILTFSTTGLFVFTIVFSLINYKFFTGIKLFLFAAMVPLFYVGVFALQSQVHTLGLSVAQTDKINNILNLLTLKFDEVDSSGRGDLVEKGMYYINDHPIIGNGIDYGVDKLVHNTYVGLWVDSGVFTFLCFIFILMYTFFKTFGLKPQVRFFAMSILVVLYIFMISLQSVINQPYLIVLFVFVGYLIEHYKKGSELSNGLPNTQL
jgi:hypothetical protein